MNSVPTAKRLRWLAAAFVWIWVLSAGRTASARAFKRTLGKGETLKSLAKQFYGNAKAEVFIRLASGVNKRPPAGTEVNIPTAWTYRVRKGDAWWQLGRDYLGDRRRGRLLATLNGKSPFVRPPVRHLITIPAHLYFKSDRPTKLKRIVKVYYRRARSAERKRLAQLVREYNSLKSDEVPAGKRIMLPVMKLRVRPEMTPAELPVPDPATRRRLKRTIAAVQRHLDKGAFHRAAATAMLHTGRARWAPEIGARLFVLLCTALTALEQNGAAQEAARKAMKLDPALTLDPVKISPKIRVFFRKAGWKPKK